MANPDDNSSLQTSQTLSEESAFDLSPVVARLVLEKRTESELEANIARSDEKTILTPLNEAENTLLREKNIDLSALEAGGDFASDPYSDTKSVGS